MTTTETQLERTVREEQEAHDQAEVEPRRQNVETDEPDEVEADDEPDEPNTEQDGQTTAFDRSQYDREDLQIAKIDGQSIDRIKIKLTGEIHLDRSDPSDVAVYNELRFGRDVALVVEGRINKTGAEGATDREGDLDVVIGTKTLKVASLRKPAGADWVQDA